MKIQPIDFDALPKPQPLSEAAVKPLLKLRFKWLFERPFSSVLKSSSPDKSSGNTEPPPPQNFNKDDPGEFEPSSVCLAKMVRNFMEENNEKQQQQRCGRKTCNCFNGNCTDTSDDELESHNSCLSHVCDVLKSLVPCSSVTERNLLADTSKIVDKNRISKRKDELCREIVADGLVNLGYKASICRSKWEKTPSFLAGEYEYLDVIHEDERLIIDLDFRSEFEIARSTKAYKLVLQTLPNIFIGKADRLEKIISIVSGAAKQSLKKKGMPLPPWRRADYVKSKWLSPYTRIDPGSMSSGLSRDIEPRGGTGEFDLIIRDESSSDDNGDCVFAFSNGNSPCEDDGDGVKCVKPLVNKWDPMGVRIVTGLASIIEDKP